MSDILDRSFNQEFCKKLEYILCSVFAKSKDKDLKRFWCDGVSWKPYYNDKVNSEYLSIEEVESRKSIITTAKLGVSGQDYYEMKIKLGNKSIEAYKKESTIINCIPINQDLTWIEIDTEKRKIQIELL